MKEPVKKGSPSTSSLCRRHLCIEYASIIGLVCAIVWLCSYYFSNQTFIFSSCALPSENSQFSFVGMIFFILVGIILASTPCLKTTFTFDNTKVRLSKLGHILTLIFPFFLTFFWGMLRGTYYGDFYADLVDSLSVSLFVFFGFLISSWFQKKAKSIRRRLEKEMPKRKYSEAPEVDMSEDIVGIQALVDDIAEQLCVGNDVSLTGRYGSGKSTVVHHVKQNLQEDENIGFAYIGLWGLSTENALNAILSGILESAENIGVDTITVKNLPKSVTSALSSAHWSFSLGASILRAGNERISTLLQRCDWLLAANGVKIIVCIEDLERYAPKGNVEAISDLLDLIKHMSCLTLFITYVDGFDDSSNENPRFVRERLCNTHRLMPDMKQQKVWQRIEDLRVDCLIVCEQKEDLLESNSDLKKELKNISLDDSLLEEAESEFVGAIVHLLRTPRTLKRVFKRIEDAWSKSLHGEVAFWDLLILTTLREVNESIFGHFVDNRHMFIKGEIRSNNKKELDEKLNIFVENPLIHKLLSPIFPYLRSEDYDSKVKSRQIFALAERDRLALINNPELIWPRIYEMRIPDNQIPIQYVLKESKRLIKGEKNLLLERIQNDDKFSLTMSEYAGPHIIKGDLQAFLPVVLDKCINKMSEAQSRCAHVWSILCNLWDWKDANGFAITTLLDKLFPESCGIATTLVDILYSRGHVNYVVPVANAVFNKLPGNPKDLVKFLKQVNSEKGILNLSMFIRKLRGASSYQFDDTYGRFFKLLASYKRKTRYRDSINFLLVHLTCFEKKIFESISYEPVAHNFLTQTEVDSLLSRLDEWYNSTKNNHSNSEYESTIRLIGHILDSPNDLELWKSRLVILEKEDIENDEPE